MIHKKVASKIPAQLFYARADQGGMSLLLAATRVLATQWGYTTLERWALNAAINYFSGTSRIPSAAEGTTVPIPQGAFVRIRLGPVAQRTPRLRPLPTEIYALLPREVPAEAIERVEVAFAGGPSPALAIRAKDRARVGATEVPLKTIPLCSFAADIFR